MHFEWDEAKRLENGRKHAVDFADAVGVFYDDHAMTRVDPDARGENRFVTPRDGLQNALAAGGLG